MSKPLLDIMNLNLNRYGSKFNMNKFKVTLEEELQEIYDAETTNDIDEFIDGCLDAIVVLAGAITQKGYNPELALKQVVKHITSRKQDPTQATAWLANPDLQDVEKWQKDKSQSQNEIYQTNFSTCKLPSK